MIAIVLDWVAGEGFRAFFGRDSRVLYADAREYRERYLIDALRTAAISG